MTDWAAEAAKFGATVDSGGAVDWEKEAKKFGAKVSKPAAPQEKSFFQNLLDASGFIEPVAAMATGAIAKPLSDVAGLAALPLHAAGIIDTSPLDVKNAVQGGMTYKPRTQLGQNLTEYNPLALAAKGVDWVGGKVEQGVNAIAPDSQIAQGIGRGAHEAVNQMPGFVGVKVPAIAAAGGSILKDAARTTMQSALKPSVVALRSGKAGAAIDTMLDNGINVSRGGLEKLRSGVDDYNTQITAAIANSPATVSARSVASRLADVESRARNQVNPQADLAAIGDVRSNFLDHPTLQGTGPFGMVGDSLPVATAQELKQGTYRALSDRAYGEQGSATIEAQKALARGLKEEIATAVPEVRGLNAAESKLLQALPLVERRVLTEANKNPAGLSLLAKTPGAMAAFMADRSGLFKSLVARMLNSTAETFLPKLANSTVTAPAAAAISQAQQNVLPQRAGLLPIPKKRPLGGGLLDPAFAP